MNDVVMDESKVFDACALAEEVEDMTDINKIKSEVSKIAVILNIALEQSESVK